MHIFFSGINGAAMGPLAMIAQQAGYEVSGSDKQDTAYMQYLHSHGINRAYVGQTREAIAAIHASTPIDWYVFSSAVAIEQPDHPEFVFCRENGIKMSKRAELLNQLMLEQNLKLIAIAGTHGKTTTTAMVVWLFKQLGIPISYSVGAKMSFGEMGEFNQGSEYFAYECDEFDRNFLAFDPHISLISGIDWDHPDIYPTRQEYNDAFVQFIGQSQRTVLWRDDAERIALGANERITIVCLRRNYSTMVTLRDAVYAADEQGKSTEEVEAKLQALRSHVTSHMNTSLRSGSLSIKEAPIQLGGLYNQAVAAEKARVSRVNESLFTEAQTDCEKRYPIGLSGSGRIPCVEEYINARGEKERSIPREVYMFDFASPRWSSDAAGIFLALTICLLIFTALKFVSERFIIAYLKHRNF